MYTAVHHSVRSICLALAMLFVLTMSTQAQPLQSDTRPQDVILSDLVYPQERQELQVSFAPELPRLSDHRSLEMPLIIEYGLTDAWQVEAAWSRPPLVSGASHAFEIGTQYSWLDISGSPVHAALGVEAEWEGSTLEAIVPALTAAVEAGRLHVFVQGFATVVRGEKDALEAIPFNSTAPEEAGPEETGTWGVQGGAIMPVRRVILASEIGWSDTGAGSRYALVQSLFAPLADGWEVGVGLPLWMHNGRTMVGGTVLLTYEFELRRDDD